MAKYYINSKAERAEKELAEKERNLSLYQSLEKLQKNKDFQNLIEKGYFQEEAARTAINAGRRLGSNAGDDANEKYLHGFGALRMYFEMVSREGLDAISTVPELKLMLDEGIQE